WGVCEEGTDDRIGSAVEGFNVRPAAWTGARDDLRLPVAVQIGCRHPHAAPKQRRVSEERTDHRLRNTIKHLHMRTTTRTSTRDDLCPPITVHISRSHKHATPKHRRISQERTDHRPRNTIKHLHMRTPTRP